MITPKFRIGQRLFAFMEGKLQHGLIEEISTREHRDAGMNQVQYNVTNIRSWVDEDEAFGSIEDFTEEVNRQIEAMGTPKDPEPKKSKWQDKLDQMAEKKKKEAEEQQKDHRVEVSSDSWLISLLIKRGYRAEDVNSVESIGYIETILDSGKFPDVTAANEWEKWAESKGIKQFDN